MLGAARHDDHVLCLLQCSVDHLAEVRIADLEQRTFAEKSRDSGAFQIAMNLVRQIVIRMRRADEDIEPLMRRGQALKAARYLPFVD